MLPSAGAWASTPRVCWPMFLLRLLLRAAPALAVAGLLAFCSDAVFAQCQVWRYRATFADNSVSGYTYTSPAAACEAVYVAWTLGSKSSWSLVPPSPTPHEGSVAVCKGFYQSNQFLGLERNIDATQVAGPCPVCTAGASSVLNRTEAWTRTGNPNADDYVWRESSILSGTVCDGQCAGTVPSDGSVLDCWRSRDPSSQGLHRVSCDYAVTLSGAECSTRTEGTDPAADPLACPGFVGEVNGVRTCVGRVSSPLPAASAPGDARQGNQVNANPAAGRPPTSGPGSGAGPNGRTPVVGNGGPDGGGSGATAGAPGGGGSVPDLKVETCGIPGKPPCKIDESGTPNASGAFTTATAQMDAAMTSGIEVMQAHQSTLPATWLWVVPVGSCAPVSVETRLGELSVDPCSSESVALWRAVLAYAFYVMGALYMWRSVVRVER